MTSYLFLTSNQGVERAELAEPWAAIESGGESLTHAALERGPVRSMEGDVEPSAVFEAEVALADVTADEHDVLVLPGGTVNADTLRADADAVAFIKGWAESGKPVAAICHAPWALVEAGVLPGKTLTSYHSVQTDVRNAGGTWVDEEVFVCGANGWTLVTSRNPGDIEVFNKAVLDLGKA